MESVIKTLHKSGVLIYPVTFTNAVKDNNGKPLSVTISEILSKLGTVEEGAIADAPVDGKAYIRQDGVWKIIEFPYQTSEIDHTPGMSDTTYTYQGKQIRYPLGAEVYHRADNYTAFYRLHDFVDGNAYWQETSRMVFTGYYYLKGSTYFDETVKIIKQGTLNG